VASVVAILVMIPAGYTFYRVFKESRFMIQSRQFINETIGVYQFGDRGRFMDNLTDIRYNADGESVIEVVTMGDELIPDNVIATWRAQKSDFPYLANTELRVVQGGRDDSEEKFNYVNELYEAKKAELLNKDERIRLLEGELTSLSKFAGRQIPFREISVEAQTNYENLARLGYSYKISTDFNKIDTVPLFEADWKSNVARNDIQKDMVRLEKWLRLRLNDSTLQLREVTD
jgi:hypothetical protein